MPPKTNKFALALVIVLALAALVLTALAPGFGVDNTVVYQGF